ncbi:MULTISPECIES: hypothetical protein [unclassified Sphingomonas]|nr:MULTISPECIES: hypothetical protein [unclassified Sphingomonas]
MDATALRASSRLNGSTERLSTPVATSTALTCHAKTLLKPMAVSASPLP